MRMLHTRVSTHCLRWLSEGAQEGATHTIAVGETRLPSDDVTPLDSILENRPPCSAILVSELIEATTAFLVDFFR